MCSTEFGVRTIQRNRSNPVIKRPAIMAELPTSNEKALVKEKGPGLRTAFLFGEHVRLKRGAVEKQDVSPDPVFR